MIASSGLCALAMGRKTDDFQAQNFICNSKAIKTSSVKKTSITVGTVLTLKGIPKGTVP